MKFLRLKKAEVVQPNKPKPTTILPQNMEWSWDPEAADWVAVMKDNTNVTPPLYNPQNQNAINQNTTSYMNMVKSSNNYTDENTPEYESRVREAYKQLAGMIEEIDILKDYAKRSGDLRLFDAYLQLGHEVANEWDVKPEAVFGEMVLSSPELPQKLADIDEENFNKEVADWRRNYSSKNVKSSNKVIKFVRNSSIKCLNEFLDGPRYSQEIKIEAGLIKNGLVKYAGFDFNRGTKYSITEKGLKVLRSAAEKEHNEALNEREKLAYLFGFNTDKETTLDTTGKVIKSEKRFHIHLPGNFYTQEIYGNTLEEALENYGYKLQDIVEWYDDEGNGEYVGDISSVKESSFKKQFSIIESDDKDIIVIDTGSGYLQVFENKDTYTYGGHNVGEQLYQFDIDDESKHNGIAVLNVDDMISKDFYTITFENFDNLEEFVWKLKEATTQKEIDSLLNSKPKKVDSSKTFTITEADGSELGKVTASSKLDALVKFGIEHPEYADSRSIKADDLYSPNHKDPKLEITIGEEERLIKQVAKDYDISEEMSEFIFGGLRGFSKDWKINEQHIEIIAKDTFLRPIDIELIAKDFGFKTEDKKIDAQYEQTTNTKEPYPNPSETPHDDVILENHDGWVNTANKK